MMAQNHIKYSSVVVQNIATIMDDSDVISTENHIILTAD